MDTFIPQSLYSRVLSFYEHFIKILIFFIQKNLMRIFNLHFFELLQEVLVDQRGKIIK